MQRVRIGITGLACVFLVVLLAAAVVGFRSEDPRSMTAAANAASNEAADQPKDPLAELGVAPGGPAPDDSPTQQVHPKP